MSPKEFNPDTMMGILAFGAEQAKRKPVIEGVNSWLDGYIVSTSSPRYDEWRRNTIAQFNRTANKSASVLLQTVLIHTDQKYKSNADTVSLATASAQLHNLIHQGRILFAMQSPGDIRVIEHELLNYYSEQFLGLKVDPDFRGEFRSPLSQSLAEGTLWNVYGLTQMHSDITPDFMHMGGDKLHKVLQIEDYDYLPPIKSDT